MGRWLPHGSHRRLAAVIANRSRRQHMRPFHQASPATQMMLRHEPAQRQRQDPAAPQRATGRRRPRTVVGRAAAAAATFAIGALTAR
jgi:hypothetical protein